MKKILGIVVLGFLLSGNAYASCRSEGLNWSWYFNQNNTAAHFDFSNTGNKNFYIDKLVLYSATQDIVASRGTRIHIKPYGKFNTEGSWGIGLQDINVQYIKTGSISCIATTEKKALEKKNEGWFGTKKKKGWFRWWYIPIALVALGIISEIIKTSQETAKKSNTKLGTRKRKEDSTSASSGGENFFADVWEGKKSLGETFWLYFFVINGIISFGAGSLAVSNDNNIFILAAVASNIWAGIGVWNSSTNYQLKKIKEKQPHGWAYAAKVAVVLNFIVMISQAGLLLSAS